MTTLTFTISIPLTDAQIIRNRSTIDGLATEDEKREVAELAQEVHAIIAEVQARFSAASPAAPRASTTRRLKQPRRFCRI